MTLATKMLKNSILLVSGGMLFMACAKTETNIIKVEGPRSVFETYVIPDFSIYSQQTFAARVDSAFYFKNRSDSGDMVTYHWDFGDGHTSSEWQPAHRYDTRGTYNVTLETRLNGQFSDKSTATLRAFIGQTDFTFGQGIDFVFVDIQQMDAGGFVTIGYRQSMMNWGNPPDHFIQYLDDTHTQIASHPLPSGYYYQGFARLSGGDLVAWVNEAEGSEKKFLLKVGPEGQLRWVKQLDQVEQIYQIGQTADGNLLILARRSDPNIPNVLSPRTYLIKTDIEGAVLWDFHFVGSAYLYGSGNFIEEEDGYVIAGSDERDDYSDCWSCTSFSLVKISKNGAVRWRKQAPWGAMNSDGLAWVYRFDDGGYLMAAKRTRGLYFFSADGTLQDRRLIPEDASSVAITASGNIVVQGDYRGSGFRVSTYGFDRQGVLLWETGIANKSVGSSLADSWGVKVIALKQGGAVSLANRVDFDYEGNNHLYYTGILQELNDQGELQ